MEWQVNTLSKLKMAKWHQLVATAFSSTCHTKQLNAWPMYTPHHPVMWWFIIQPPITGPYEMEPPYHTSASGHLTTLRNEPLQK